MAQATKWSAASRETSIPASRASSRASLKTAKHRRPQMSTDRQRMGSSVFIRLHLWLGIAFGDVATGIRRPGRAQQGFGRTTPACRVPAHQDARPQCTRAKRRQKWRGALWVRHAQGCARQQRQAGWRPLWWLLEPTCETHPVGIPAWIPSGAYPPRMRLCIRCRTSAASALAA